MQISAASSGVPEEMIVGIIGVETYYGRITGSYRVLDALCDAGISATRRGQNSFASEVKAVPPAGARGRDEATADATGSYAGAMGRPQFMPSSYRAYAIDSTGDGKRDIWNNWADVAGSIANYFNGARLDSAGEEVVSASDARRRLGQRPAPEPANTAETGR